MAYKNQSEVFQRNNFLKKNNHRNMPKAKHFWQYL